MEWGAESITKGYEMSFSKYIMATTLANPQQLSLLALDLPKKSPARIQMWVEESILCGPTTYY